VLSPSPTSSQLRCSARSSILRHGWCTRRPERVSEWRYKTSDVSGSDSRGVVAAKQWFVPTLSCNSCACGPTTCSAK
jgi:hypothetical protein